MRNRSTRFTLILMLALALTGVGLASAQALDVEWEYLSVSYGTTLFADPVTSLEDGQASNSKVLMLNDLGIDVPQEAATLQRNIDVLGRLGWELVSIVGGIGGDQQLVFKRPYDPNRSAEEAARIEAEREAILAQYNATPPAPEAKRIIDLDYEDRQQAIAERNEATTAYVRNLIEGSLPPNVKVTDTLYENNTRTLDALPELEVTIVIDVTDTALVGEGQYRSSLVLEALDAARESARPAFDRSTGFLACGRTQATVEVYYGGAIYYDDAEFHVGTRYDMLCFTPQDTQG